MDGLGLGRFDPARNMARFYAVDIQPTLFGDLIVVRSGDESAREGGGTRPRLISFPALACPEKQAAARRAARSTGTGHADRLRPGLHPRAVPRPSARRTRGGRVQEDLPGAALGRLARPAGANGGAGSRARGRRRRPGGVEAGSPGALARPVDRHCRPAGETRGGLPLIDRGDRHHLAGGRLVIHVFGPLAEFERSISRERTRAGLDAAKACGRTAAGPLPCRPRTSSRPRPCSPIRRSPSRRPNGSRWRHTHSAGVGGGRSALGRR